MLFDERFFFSIHPTLLAWYHTNLLFYVLFLSSNTHTVQNVFFFFFFLNNKRSGFFPCTLGSLSSLGSQACKDLSSSPSVVFGIFTFLRLDTLSPTSVGEPSHSWFISFWSNHECTTTTHVYTHGCSRSL